MFPSRENHPTVNTRVILVEVEMGGEKQVMGAMADAVQEVLDLEGGITLRPA